ncbi:ABC transporter substrate-binding protein [Bacillaceae bacterium Marseille-Q3522]|nr:ABC transporter substrate-binding protein [Bacillaceae bacterium Marseille-Q3522]
MKKLYSFLLTFLLVAGLLAGCGSGDTSNENSAGNQTENAGNQENAAFPVTIKDAAGEDVIIEQKPEKIVSLIPSNTEIVFALGAGDKVVGVTDFDNYPQETASIEKVGGMEFNIEKIIALAPDVVLAHASSAHNSAEGMEQLRNAGVAVVVVNDAKTFAEVYNSIEMIGKVTGETETAAQLITDMKDDINAIKEKAANIKENEKKKVYIEVSPVPDAYAAGKNTFMDEMLTMIHAENVVTEEGWPKIDQEAIINQNPDVVLTTYGYYTEDPVGQVTGRDGWQDVNAVKNKQVVDVNSDQVTRSGPRLVKGVEEIAKAVYPDIFK